MALAMAFHGKIAGRRIDLVVLVDCRPRYPEYMLFQRQTHRHRAAMIFDGKFRRESIFWEDLQLQAPELLQAYSSLKLQVDSEAFIVTASTNSRKLMTVAVEVKVHSLSLDVEKDRVKSRI